MNRQTQGALRLSALALGASLMLLGVSQNVSAAPKSPKVDICHATSSNSNPYVSINVAEASVDGDGGNDSGQGDHYSEHSRDIIPPISGIHGGLNWTTEGQAIWNNGCNPVASTTSTTSTTVPTECDESDDDSDGHRSFRSDSEGSGDEEEGGEDHGEGCPPVTTVPDECDESEDESDGHRSFRSDDDGSGEEEEGGEDHGEGCPPVTTVPATTVPPTTVPETTVPPTTVPETTVPPTTVPETTVPPTTVPETTVPPTTVPETTVPPTSITPRSTVPDTTVPDTTVPDTTVPDTTVPDTTVPPTTVPPTTVPGTSTTVSTSTVPAEVLTEVTTVDVLGATLVRGAVTPAEEPAVQAAQVQGETLAFTGSSTGLPILLAGGLLFLGAAMTLLSRRRIHG